jgi:hypothetical protein
MPEGQCQQAGIKVKCFPVLGENKKQPCYDKKHQPEYSIGED